MIQDRARWENAQGEASELRPAPIAIVAVIPDSPLIVAIRQIVGLKEGTHTGCSALTSSIRIRDPAIQYLRARSSHLYFIPGRSWHTRPVENMIPARQHPYRITQTALAGGVKLWKAVQFPFP